MANSQRQLKITIILLNFGIVQAKKNKSKPKRKFARYVAIAIKPRIQMQTAKEAYRFTFCQLSKA